MSSAPCEPGNTINAAAGVDALSQSLTEGVDSTVTPDALFPGSTSASPPRGPREGRNDDEARAQEIALREAAQDQKRAQREESRQVQQDRADDERQALLDSHHQLFAAAVEAGRVEQERRDNPAPVEPPPPPAATEPGGLALRGPELQATEHVHEDDVPQDDHPVPAPPATDEASANVGDEGAAVHPSPAAEVPAEDPGSADAAPAPPLVSCADWQDGMEGPCDSNRPASDPAPSRNDVAGDEHSMV